MGDEKQPLHLHLLKVTGLTVQSMHGGGGGVRQQEGGELEGQGGGWRARGGVG